MYEAFVACHLAKGDNILVCNGLKVENKICWCLNMKEADMLPGGLMPNRLDAQTQSFLV